LVSKMNRNKRETDPVSVIFGSNQNFYLFVSWTPYTVQSSNSFMKNTRWRPVKMKKHPPAPQH